MINWQYDSFESIGRGHQDKNIPCQDKTHIEFNNGIIALALSDGCGSSKWSHLGAEITVKTICSVLINEFDYLYNTQNGVEIKTYIIEKIVKTLEEYSAKNQYALKDLDATLLFAAKKEDKYLIGRLGDGIIGIVRDKKLSVASIETKSDEVNSTYYPSMIRRSNPNRVYNEFDLKKTDKKIDGFVLMSDGSADSLIDRRVPFQLNFANAVKNMFNIIKSYKDINNHDQIQSFMDNSIIAKTSDDCSLVIACSEDIEIVENVIFKLPKPSINKNEQDNEKEKEQVQEVVEYPEIIDDRPVDVFKKNSRTYVFQFLVDKGYQSRDLDRIFDYLQHKKITTIENVILNTKLSKNLVRRILTNLVEFQLIQYTHQQYKVIYHGK